MESVRYRDALITDLPKDMGWMQCFQETKSERAEGSGEDAWESPPSSYSTAPIVHTEPKVRPQRSLPLRERQEVQEML